MGISHQGTSLIHHIQLMKNSLVLFDMTLNIFDGWEMKTARNLFDHLESSEAF